MPYSSILEVWPFGSIKWIFPQVTQLGSWEWCTFILFTRITLNFWKSTFKKDYLVSSFIKKKSFKGNPLKDEWLINVWKEYLSGPTVRQAFLWAEWTTVVDSAAAVSILAWKPGILSVATATKKARVILELQTEVQSIWGKINCVKTTIQCRRWYKNGRLEQLSSCAVNSFPLHHLASWFHVAVTFLWQEGTWVRRLGAWRQRK